MNFGEYLYQLRVSHQPKKLTQGQVGDAIGATRQYVDALEKQKPGTTPPRWEQCHKIVALLKLNESEKRKLLWLAFKERNRHNDEFYNYFHGEENPLTATRESKSKRRFSSGKIGKKQKEYIQYQCLYNITWHASDSNFLADALTQSVISEALDKHSKRLQHQLIAHTIQPETNSVVLEIGLTPMVIVDSVVREMKNLVARELRKHGKIAGHAQSVWSKNYEVATINPVETVSPVSIEKIMVHA